MSESLLPTAHFVVLIESAQEELLQKLKHRFKLEYGLATTGGSPCFLQGSRHAQWLALDFSAVPEKLPAIERHAVLVEQLYPAEAAVKINAGYIDSQRVVRAARDDAPNRVYMADGIWAEVVLVHGADGVLHPAPVCNDEWQSDRASAFLNSIRVIG